MSLPRRISRITVGVSSLLLIGGGLSLVLAWQSFLPPSSYRHLAELEPGMPRSKVLDVLGKPRDESWTPEGTELTYTRLIGWSILTVRLDAEGRYAGYVYDP